MGSEMAQIVKFICYIAMEPGRMHSRPSSLVRFFFLMCVDLPNIYAQEHEATKPTD